jgi:cellulose synthase/poly-beta-1,6-N-acetylglucosamine synthase-like glycosyltransferase
LIEHISNGDTALWEDTPLRNEPTTGTGKIAVLVPAQNEEENLPLSLSGAVKQVGPQNVYVVDDNSSDVTACVTLEYTPKIYSASRGGKAAAVLSGMERFELLGRYEGVLVLDADSRLMPDAIVCYEEQLGHGVAAVIGQLRVLDFPKGPIAAWKRHLYFYMTAIYMRGAVFYRGGMPVTPGFCTVYSTEALKNLDIDPVAPTEDIDFCWQMHRKGLGKIVYAPRACVETGVPVNFADYVKQIKRWDRGWHYAMRKYRMPLGLQWVDLVAGLMSLEILIAWLRMSLLVRLSAMGLSFGVHPALFGSSAAPLVTISFEFDVVWLVGMGLTGTTVLRDLRIAAWLPLFPLFYCFDQSINLYSAITFRRGLSAVWNPPERAKREVLA